MEHNYPGYVGAVNNDGQPITRIGEFNATLLFSDKTGHELEFIKDNMSFVIPVEFLRGRYSLYAFAQLDNELRDVVGLDSANITRVLDWARVLMSYRTD